MLAGSIITLPLRFKPDSIEVLMFWPDPSTICLLICGRWPAWLLKCLPVSCFSIQEKTITKLLVRTMIIWLKWWNSWVDSQRNSHSEAQSQENITRKKELYKEYQNFKIGAWKMWWLRSTDSQKIKPYNFKNSWFTCFNASLRTVFWQMKCWSILGFTKNQANTWCKFLLTKGTT